MKGGGFIWNMTVKTIKKNSDDFYFNKPKYAICLLFKIWITNLVPP